MAVGCAGHATVVIVPLGVKKISTAAPLTRRLTPDECYYWVNDKEQLCVAMRNDRSSLLGAACRRGCSLSLILGEPPAGSTRNYRMNKRTLRARVQRGYAHTRSASLTGI
ncbi:MAG: hypothetical protein ACE5HE_07300, partial [Phycisphaerae bacterium]